MTSTRHVYKERVEKIREAMEMRKLECVLLTRPEHTFYVSGCCSPGEGKPVVLFIPRQRDAIMIIAKHEKEVVAEESWVTDLRTYKYYSITEKPSLDEQIARLVLTSLKELNITYEKIGIEESYIPLPLFKRINEEMRNLQYEDFSSVLKEMRIVKFDEEIESIKNAVMLCDIGQDTVRNTIKEGVTLNCLARPGPLWK